MAHVNQTSCYIGIKAVLSLMKIKSSPFVLWNPGQKEVYRKAGNYIILNSPLLSLQEVQAQLPRMLLPIGKSICSTSNT